LEISVIPGANSLLSVGYVTVLLTCRAVSSPVPRSPNARTGGTPQVSVQGGFKHDFIVRVGHHKTGKSGRKFCVLNEEFGDRNGKAGVDRSRVCSAVR
jgi:hypothetical protein